MAVYDGILSLSGGITKRINNKNDTIIIRPVLKFEGATEDDNETTLAFADPTSPRTITFPDADGDVALLESGALAAPISFPVKNPSPSVTLNKGQVVYISGHSGTKPEVSLAKSDNTSTMPAFGVVTADIGPEAEGFVTQAGLLKGINTNGFSLGDVLYVSETTAGALTKTKPAGSGKLLQNIAKVIRLDASNGEILVGGAGRSAATPNLDTGKIFIGDGSNYSSQSLYTLPTANGSEGQVLRVNSSGNLVYVSNDDVVIAELSIPGLDLQTDTNAFRFNCPHNITILGLDLYLDQHSTSGDVTVTVTNTTDSKTMITLSVTGTNLSASSTSVTDPNCTTGEIVTFAITATPANAQGLRANLRYRRT